MITGFLLDEHLPKWWRRELRRAASGWSVWRVGDPDAPPLGSDDSVLLGWCEDHDFVLLTNNRKSMPKHLAEKVAKGGHVPGVFLVNPATNIITLVSTLNLIAGASLEHEYRNQIQYLPALEE
jgi:Domain of unknown function (DUF5615)